MHTGAIFSTRRRTLVFQTVGQLIFSDLKARWRGSDTSAVFLLYRMLIGHFQFALFAVWRFQITTGRLFCIMHTLPPSFDLMFVDSMNLNIMLIAMAPGMNGGKASLFHVFRANVDPTDIIWCKQLARISGNQGFRVTSMLFANSTVHDA
jgi:hypothetical protein